jgi:hypothetical protein
MIYRGPQATLQSYDSAPCPPFPPSPVSKLFLLFNLPALPVLTDRKGGKGVGEEQNHTTAKKAWPAIIIHYSLAEILQI